MQSTKVDPRVAELLGKLSPAQALSLIEKDEEAQVAQEKSRDEIVAKYPHANRDSIVFGDKHGVATYITCTRCGKSTDPASENHSPQGRLNGQKMKRADGRNFTSDLHHAGGKFCLSCKEHRAKNKAEAKRVETPEEKALRDAQKKLNLSNADVLAILKSHKVS